MILKYDVITHFFFGRKLGDSYNLFHDKSLLKHVCRNLKSHVIYFTLYSCTFRVVMMACLLLLYQYLRIFSNVLITIIIVPLHTDYIQYVVWEQKFSLKVFCASFCH